MISSSVARLRSRGLLASVALVGLVAACMQAGQRAQPVAGGSLTLPSEASGATDKPAGPLRVAFSSPRGQVGLVTEVSVVFDRPVQPLGVVSASAPLQLVPAVAGSFRWVGSRAAVFTPRERLRFATAYRLEVPAGLTALDGTRLAEPYREELQTLRPAVLSAAPSDGQEGLPLDTQLRLELNQDVTADALQAAGKLEAQTAAAARKVLPFDVVAGKEPRTLLVKPRAPLPPNAAITFGVSEALRGSEGPLPAGKPHSLTFRTYEPLRSELSCHRPQGSGGKCAPDSDVALMFNNAVRPRDVMAKLRVAPDVKLSAPYGAAVGGDEWTTYVPLRGPFSAGGQYQIELDPGVVDQFGQRLSGKVSHPLRFEDHYPRVDIGAAGRNFSGPALAVPVASRNVPRYDLLTAALTPADLLAWSAGASRRDRRAELDWLSKLSQVQVRRVSQQAPKNQIERLLVESAKVLSGGRGALAIGARYQEHARDYDVPEKLKILNVSDLGISAKLSRFGSLVWVTDRSSNAPVAGAEVVLLVSGRPERKYTTDSDGLAHIPAADFDPELERQPAERGALLLARRGADSAFALISEHIESWRLDVPSDYQGALKPYGVAFSDRGIYRPGDEVMLKGIVRMQTATGNALPPQKTLELVLRSAGGDEVGKQQVLLTEYGTFSARLRLPPGAELGSYRAVASGLDHHGFLDVGLEVAEYRPAELKLETSTDRSAYQRGDSAELEVAASYLFGGAAAGLSASLSVSRQPAHVEVPGAEGFSTSADAYYAELPATSAAGELRRETRKLDADGKLRWREKLELPGQRGPEQVRLDAEVTDLSRRSVAASGSALVHPAAFYLGVKGETTFVSAPAQVRPQVAAFTVSGQRLAGKRVTFELIERRYTYAREQSGDDYRGVSRAIDSVKARCDVTTTSETASCALNVPAAGYYLIVARSKDERGRQAEAASWVYAAGSGEPTWQDNDRRSLELVLDKKSYRVGEQARVLVKSPYKEAEALITIERSGVYRSFRRTLVGTAPTFSVAVTPELLPNAFIGVHLLPRRSNKGGPVLEPGSYRLGYASLPVSDEGKRLAVAITPDKRDYRPGQTIDVKLSVKDARGAAAAGAEVTLYAADEGVLSLVDYRTPDPLATFSAPRPLQVATLESRDAEGKLLLESLGSGRDKGRDGGGGGEMDVRRDFRQTAYFNPRLVTDARGEAKATFKLPESLTTYRLMAVAVGRDDRYGFSQQRVTVSKPLMARPALPRFLRAGDRFEAGVLVSKKGLSAGKVTVKASFTGVEAEGAREREVEVPANGSVEVRFAARAPQAVEGSVRFDVTAGSERDAAVTPLRVTPPMTPEVAAVYGRTSGAQSEQLGALQQARDDYGSLSVALSTTALVGVDQVATDLLNYPYGCSEQLASRLVPLVALGELASAVGFAPPADHQKRAAALVGELVQRQQGDGGFSMWPESARSWDAASPYVTLALMRAQQAGVAVPKPVLERARDYLRRLADISGRSRDLSTAAFALDVLAELAAPDPGGVNRLFAERQQLPLDAKALLLHAAVRSKLGSDVVAELKRELEASLHLNGDRALVMAEGYDGSGEVLRSSTRTQALVLRALAVTGKHPLLTELARGLIGARKQGRFRTTHEGAWALLALADYRRVAEPEAPRFDAVVSLAGERLGSAQFASPSTGTQRFELPMARVKSGKGASLVFEKDGAGVLFYEARLRYARAELPRTPLDAGFYVEKSLHAITAESLQKGVVGAPPGIAREIAAGDLVLVDLTVVAPADREQMVLDDPLPAGLEAIDPRLSTTAQWLKGAMPAEEPAEPWEQRQATPYDRSEVRDDRVVFFAETLPAGLYHYRYLARATTLGRFVLPPTRVEEMYAPEVFGRTGGSEVTVR